MELTHIAKLLSFASILCAACASDPEAPPAAAALAAQGVAPSYEELFDTYFARGTPGHCATAGCHADPGHNVWLCMDADSCYEGMLGVGLIDPRAPARSTIVDPHRSPLTWFNPRSGNMPLDAQGENDTAKAAIEAWIAAGAPRQ